MSIEKPLEERPQIIVEPKPRVRKCDQCGGLDSFLQVSGFRRLPAFEQAYARCRDCGRMAQIRKV